MEKLFNFDIFFIECGGSDIMSWEDFQHISGTKAFASGGKL